MSQMQFVRKISLSKTFHKDQLIYNSNGDQFFPEYKKVLIFNRQFGNKSQIIAKLETSDGSLIEKNSDDIVKVIGEKRFETLFLALCSVINQECRIKGILSILNTVKNNENTINESQDNGKSKVDVQCQTDEIRISTSDIKKRRIRKHLAPYVVPSLKPPEPKIRKVIINIPANGTKIQESNNESTKCNDNGLSELPDLGHLHDDNSNDTVCSSISYKTTDTLMNNPYSILDMVDNHTLASTNLKEANVLNKTKSSIPLTDSTTDNLPTITQPSLLNKTTEVNSSIKAIEANPLTEPEANLNKNGVNKEKSKDIIASSDNGTPEINPLQSFVLNFPDCTSIYTSLPTKPEDPFHIVTTENLKYVPKRELIELQMKIDEKLCEHATDEDGYLPIHVAILNNDMELLKRQCFILNKKIDTIDILANDMTALKLSLFQPTVAATVILLQFNADPLYTDDNHCTYFHIAAELKTDHLSVLLHHCRMNARKIISDSEEIQFPGWKTKSDTELGEYLLDRICTMCDNQGYTPLMLASHLGIYENVKLLVEASKTSVNKQMPNTGNTALYIAVASCCNMASGHFSKFKPTGRWTLKIDQQIKSTIEILLKNDADPTIDNYVGSNVILLLTEFPIIDLITLISHNTKIKNFKSPLFDGDFQNLMLVKENEKIEVKNINSKPVMKNEVIISTSNLVKSDFKSTSNLVKNDFKPTSNLGKKDCKLTSNLVKNDLKPISNIVKNDLKPISNLVKNDLKPASNIVKNDFKPTSNLQKNDLKLISNLGKDDLKPTSNTLNKQNNFKLILNEQNDCKLTLNELNCRKIAPKPNLNNKSVGKISILKDVVIKSPKITAESSKTTILNTEPTISNTLIPESTKIIKPMCLNKDNNFVYVSRNSTKTDSIVATPSNYLTYSTNIKKNVVVIKKSIKKIDLSRCMKQVTEKRTVLKRINDGEIPSTSNIINKLRKT